MRAEDAMPSSSDSFASPERSAGAFARERAARFGDAPALVHEGKTLTYRALDSRSRRIARGR
jgi:non-ribosomal peptide synthetase component E (peptide arylation enzyme)